MFHQTTFEGNTGTRGGAIDMTSSTVEFSGQTTCNYNLAASSGGAGGCLAAASSQVSINGPLCAYSNNALFKAGFAAIQGDSTLQINAPATVADNTPQTIVTENAQNPASEGKVRCGNNAPWAFPPDDTVNRKYFITGRLCACDTQFIQGTSNTCETCDGIGRRSPKCDCPQCNPGSGPCCTRDAFFDTTTVCGHPMLARPYGLQESSVDGKTGGARIQSVSAHEAAAWLTGTPEYEREWPACQGKCVDGSCALRWDHPACCYVPFRDDDYYEYKTRGRSYAQSAEDGKDGATLGGFWQSKNFFCWR